MTQTTWTLGEIEVEVAGFFTTHHQFMTENGPMGEFTFPAFSQEGIFTTADGRRLLMHKVRWFGTTHELVEGEQVRGTADRAGFLRRDILVQLDGEEYTLAPEGAFKLGWYLADASGTRLMDIEPRGVFQREFRLVVHDVVNADLVAFAYYLVYTRKQEEAAASGAAAS